ncbi:hypothetical protein KW438_10265 [Vibrio fluvialis]|nr:hypothetical protein [Vibrio fluvialis]MBY8103934.1 hypothetical protein [Vibrio fluvialis]
MSEPDLNDSVTSTYDSRLKRLSGLFGDQFICKTEKNRDPSDNSPLKMRRIGKGDFVKQGEKRWSLKRDIDDLLGNYECFSPAFYPECNEAATRLIEVLENKYNVSQLIYVFGDEVWFKDFLIAYFSGHIALPTGRQSKYVNHWFDGVDVIGAFYWMCSLGFAKGDVYQFIAEELCVEGWNVNKSISETNGGHKVAEFIRKYGKHWSPMQYPEGSLQRSIPDPNKN